MSLLDVEDLNVEFDTRSGSVPVVRDVSFAVNEGETLGLVGESGCGKTTIGNALLGILPPNAHVRARGLRLAGSDLTQMTEDDLRAVRWSQISMIFQNAMSSLNPVFTIGAILDEALAAHSNGPRTIRDRRAADMLSAVALPLDVVRKYPHELSGGMRQRAVIALSLICGPKLVIADEPTTALDVMTQAEVLRNMRDLKQRLDLSMIFISHDMSVVMDVSDRVAVMYAGEIVEIGAAEALHSDARHPYTVGLMRAMPTLDGERGTIAAIPGEAPHPARRPGGCAFHPRCLHAVAGCRDERPPLVEMAPGHFARCVFAGEGSAWWAR